MAFPERRKKSRPAISFGPQAQHRETTSRQARAGWRLRVRAELRHLEPRRGQVSLCPCRSQHATHQGLHPSVHGGESEYSRAIPS